MSNDEIENLEKLLLKLHSKFHDDTNACLLKMSVDDLISALVASKE